MRTDFRGMTAMTFATFTSLMRNPLREESTLQSPQNRAMPTSDTRFGARITVAKIGCIWLEPLLRLGGLRTDPKVVTTMSFG